MSIHHQGAACADWRLRHDYEANGAAALAGWQATLDRVRANAPKETRTEEWV